MRGVTQERLQKVLAARGVASRRAAELLITQGKVRVNGRIVRELGTRVDPRRDEIEVEGRKIFEAKKVYYLFHKPRGMVTTLKDPEGRESLEKVVKRLGERVVPVGRLDYSTSGALLLTNDGELVDALLRPSSHVKKTYVAKVRGLLSEADIEKIERGMTLVIKGDRHRTLPAIVQKLRTQRTRTDGVEHNVTWLEITLVEGKNRQIHRMFERLGLRVMRLARLSFAGLTTDGLRPGDIRPLNADEINALTLNHR